MEDEVCPAGDTVAEVRLAVVVGARGGVVVIAGNSEVDVGGPAVGTTAAVAAV